RIGGRAPLIEISRAQATALETRLNRTGGAYRCYVGMRNWRPYIRDVIPEILGDGFDQLVVVPLTPYYSRRSVGAYFAAVDAALSRISARPNVAYVESWNTEPALIEMFAAKLRHGLAQLANRGFPDPVVWCTAPGARQRLRVEGGPYERELSETMALVCGRLPPLRAGMAWQGAGRTEEAGLGPPLEDALDAISQAGERAVLV